MAYNYILVGNCQGDNLYNYVFSDAKKISYATYDGCFPKNRVARLFKRLHYSAKINNFVNLPFKDIWVKKRIERFADLFNNNNKICFILLSYCIDFDVKLFASIVKERFPDAKIVVLLTDLISANKEKVTVLNNSRDVADLIYTFDSGDSEKYNLKLCNLPYSNISYSHSEKTNKYDVCFIGRAKNRLEEIVSAYKFFESHRLRCGFYIVGVPLVKQVFKDKINYCDLMGYSDYLKIIKESKCILEILQKGAAGNSVRVNEAIYFNKLLISNNKRLVNNSFYEPQYMKVYDDIEKIDVENFISINDINYQNKEKIFLPAFFKMIEEDLNFFRIRN